MAERERESLLCLCLVKMETFISSCALPCTSKFSRIAQMESETRFYTYVRVLRESRVLAWVAVEHGRFMAIGGA